MSPTPKTQPSNVSTADTPERPENVFTEEPEVAAAKKADLAEPGDPPGQTSDDSATPPKKRKGKHPNRPAERRISALTKKLDKSQSENEALREQLEAAQAKPPAKKPEPQLRDFKTPQEYAKAFTAWETEQKPAPKPKPKADPATPAASVQQAHADDLKAFAKDGTDRLGDKFQEAFTNKDLAINQVMGEYLLDSDLGPDIMVYLHAHQDEAKQIWLDSPEDAAKRLGDIEDELEKGSPGDQGDDDSGEQQRDASGKFTKKSDPKPKTGTKSKAPPPPGDSEKGETHHDPNLETAGMDDYATTRRKQIKNAGGRI